MLKKGISVVVCCHNSGKLIIPTIKALSNQKLNNGLSYEIILVDNNCIDNTIELAKMSWNKKNSPLRVIKESKKGLIHARKRGVEVASFNVLVFVDDDNILCEDWLCKVYEIFLKRAEVGAVGGYVEAFPECKPPEWFDDYLGVYACGPQGNPGIVSHARKMLVGAGLSFRTHIIKSIFSMEAPLFLVGRTGNTLLRGDDAELCMRCVLLGWELWYEETLKLKHYLPKERIRWDYIIRTRRGGGAADIILHMYRRLISNKLPRSYSECSSYICHEWNRFWRNKNELSILINEGNSQAFQYSFLQGLTECFLTFDEDKYNYIYNTLIKYFASNDIIKNKFLQKNKQKSSIITTRSSSDNKLPTSGRKDLLVTIADSNYVMQAKQLFSSVYFNAAWDGDYMLLSQNISDNELLWFKNKGILVKECDPILLETTNKKAYQKWPTTVLNTIYLFNTEFKRWGNIICIDSDMIVRASLDKLKSIKGFAAVQGLFAPTLSVRIKKHKDRISRETFNYLKKQYKFNSPTFNGGIVVFNTDIIQDNTFDQLRELVIKYQGSLTSNEEEVLNLYFNNNWKKLPYVYNVYVNSFKNPEKTEGIILHFMAFRGTENEKPWNDKSPFYKEWKNLLDKAERIDLSTIPNTKSNWSNIKIQYCSLIIMIKNMMFYYRLNYWLPLATILRKTKRKFLGLLAISK